MKGSCIIDGKDIADWGMFILREGDYDFISFPQRKEPAQNNWYENHGVDADLTEVYFKEKNVTVKFYISAETENDFIRNLNAFNKLISAPGYRKIYSREFGKTFDLRYVTSSSYEHSGGLNKKGKKQGEISVEFSMDNPLQVFTGTSNLIPRKGHDSLSYVSINNRDLSEFGIIVNQCYNTILQPPAIKPPLVRSFEYSTGLITYTPLYSKNEKKQVIIDCTMLAASRSDFYYNYEALFNNLRSEEAISLSVAAGDVKCYYNSMQGFKKLKNFSKEIKVQFSLILTCINNLKIRNYLVTEDRAFYITTENNYRIRV